jgi:hypothetical protein
MQLMSWFRRRDVRDLEGHAGVLLVDPDPYALDGRRQQLIGPKIPVRAARCGLEVFCWEPRDAPATVVLNQRLGAAELEALAEYTRHRWPEARILIVGDGPPPLEDQLYDQTAADSCAREEFLEAVHQCAQRGHLLRHG